MQFFNGIAAGTLLRLFFGFSDTVTVIYILDRDNGIELQYILLIVTAFMGSDIQMFLFLIDL